MRVIDLLVELNNFNNGKTANLPKKIKMYGNIYELKKDGIDNHYYYDGNLYTLIKDLDDTCDLNHEIEIIEEFTKEDFIKERMKLDGITIEQFNKRYEVKKCNCGMPYCRGFIAVEKAVEDNKIEPLDIHKEKNCKNNWKWKCNGYNISTPQKIIGEKLNEIIDKLNKMEDNK